MLKLIREDDRTFVVLTDIPGMSGKGTFEQAVRRLVKLRVPMDDIHLAVEELDRDREPGPRHNLVEFGVGLGDGRPKFIFTQYVELNERIKGVA